MTTVVDLNDLESQVPLNPNDDSTTKNDLGGELDGELSKGKTEYLVLLLKNLPFYCHLHRYTDKFLF